MNLYKVVAKKKDEPAVIKWVGSQSEASSTRRELVEAGFKRVEIETETVSVPTDKLGLIGFLNSPQA